MPSSFGLWFGAYAESLADDLLALKAAYDMVNTNPLGSGAGYGSSIALNRQMTTDLLGFSSLAYNVVYAQMQRGKMEKNVLSLTAEEQDMLKMAKSNFENVIVLINSTNALECDFIDNEEYGIDAVLWIGYTGGWGLNGVADILVGNANPSGRLVDTYCYDNTTTPSMESIYGADYTNYDPKDEEHWYSVANGQLDGNHHYITYQEGIYVGYRYYETRYEDIVMGTANVGDYDYATTVAYPFGYGLSYTEFEYSNFKAEYNKDTDSFDVEVDVTNTGDVDRKRSSTDFISSLRIQNMIKKNGN